MRPTKIAALAATIVGTTLVAVALAAIVPQDLPKATSISLGLLVGSAGGIAFVITLFSMRD